MRYPITCAQAATSPAAGRESSLAIIAGQVPAIRALLIGRAVRKISQLTFALKA